MFSPPHTHQASALARLPAESGYWMENLPVEHGKYNSGIFTVLPLGFAQSGSNNAQLVVYTTRMITIMLSMELFVLILQLLRFVQSDFRITPMASYGTRLG